MLPLRDPPQNKRPTQTESEGLEKIIPSNGKEKKAGVAILIRQNRLQKGSHKKKLRRSLDNTQGKNPSRRHKHCKCICTQHVSTQIHKENFGGLQERYRQQQNYSYGF